MAKASNGAVATVKKTKPRVALKKAMEETFEAAPAPKGRRKKADGEGAAPKAIVEKLTIPALEEKVICVRLVGTAPYMQAKFSEKSKLKMMRTQEAGSQAKSRTQREPRDYEADYLAAMYKLPGGGYGIPASAFRNASISACKLVGFHMTKAKLSIFIEADGFDVTEGTPLVELVGKPEKSIMPARNANMSCDLRSRPMWRKWSVDLRVRFDTCQFSVSDIVNLLIRVGRQVGVGEGRPDSKTSNGMGFGLFDVQLVGDE